MSTQSTNTLEDKFPFETFTFRTGYCIIEEGTPPKGISILIEGGVKCVLNEKERRVVHIFFPGDIFGLSEILNNEDFSFSVIAMTNGKIHVVDKDIFLGKLNNNPVELLPLMKTLCSRINTAEQKLINKTEKADIRLIDLLINLSNLSAKNKDIDINVNTNELSSLIDVSKKKIKTSLEKLSNEGLLRVSNETILISDKTKLETFQTRTSLQHIHH